MMPRVTIVLLIALAIFIADAWSQKIVCNRPNEVYACGSACQTTCPTLGQPCPIINIQCNDACYCKPGYARINNDGSSECIPESQCPI